MTARRVSRSALVLLGLVVAAGAFTRIFQFSQQVLLDDEWHAIHQLSSGKTPAQLFLSIGHADYSIPLGLLYWLEGRWFGLSELGMRWPMLLAGLATLVLLPAWAWRRYSPRVALIFAGLLATSPLLLIYSQTARPYALTLLLSLVGIYGFDRYRKTPVSARSWAAVYVLCFALCAWLHVITVPLMCAPLVQEAARKMAGRTAASWRQLAWAGLPAAVLAAALVGPPLLAEPEGLALKAGQASVGIDTVLGALHAWLGTPSLLCVIVLAALCGLGAPKLLIGNRVAQSALMGIVLTALAIVLLRPASVNHSLTFGRYLLVATPVLLLAASLGAGRLLSAAGARKWLTALGLVAFGLYFLAQSPLRQLLAVPNSHVTHSRYQFDFRPGHNHVARYQRETLAASPFWEQLAALPPDTVHVGVAPFYFETYHWDGPRWEQTSRQRVWPAFMTGFCVERRFGDVPDDGRFTFRNAWWLSRLNGTGPAPDWLVFTRPIPRFAGTPEGNDMKQVFKRCTERLLNTLGQPEYEDDVLLAWKRRPGD